MNILDMRTVLSSYIISDVISVAMIISLWLQNRRRQVGLGLWVVDFVFQLASLILIALRGVIPDFVSMVVGNALIMLGTILLYIGLERYTAKTSSQIHNYVLLALFICVQSWFALVQPSLTARNVNVSIGLLVFCSQIAWLLLYRADANMRFETRSVGLVFAAYSLVSLLRIFADLVAPQQNDLFKSGLYDVLAVMTYQMLFIGLTFALFQMINRRLIAVLERDILERKRSERILTESEERYHSLFDNMMNGFAYCQMLFENDQPQDFIYLDVNHAFEQTTGLNNVVGKKVSEVLPGIRESDPELLKRYGRVAQTGDPERFETYVSAMEMWFSISIYSPQKGYFVAVFDVITERKRAEAEIERLSRFPSENPNPVLRVDYDGRILYANQSSAPVLAAWGRTVGQDVPDDWRTQIAAVLETGESLEVELDCQGQVFLLMLAPVLVENDVNIYGREITRRKQAEEALKKSAESFRNLFEHSPVGNSMTGMDGSVHVNRAFCEMLGYSKEELSIKKWMDITYPDDVQLSAEMSQALVDGKIEQSRFEKRYVRKDGNIVWMDVSAYLQRDEKDQPQFFISAIYDITERKQAEAILQAYSTHLEEIVAERTHDLRAAQEKLIRQERLAMLGQLAGSVSHELRNPLGVISNAAYFLGMAQPDANEKVKQYLDIIEKETRTADKIITDLLDFSRIESASKTPVLIVELVQHVLARYPVPDSVSVTLKVPKGLPPVFVDPAQMAQVLGNLVVNACQAMLMPASSTNAKLVISAKPSRLNSESFVAISVKDNGIGITSENMSKLFEPLFTTKARGIGLGLAICKNLVETNDGRIEVRSQPGKGSIFTIYLPVHKEDL